MTGQECPWIGRGLGASVIFHQLDSSDAAFLAGSTVSFGEPTALPLFALARYEPLTKFLRPSELVPIFGT
jgi:hypothetical protein